MTLTEKIDDKPSKLLSFGDVLKEMNLGYNPLELSLSDSANKIIALPLKKKLVLPSDIHPSHMTEYNMKNLLSIMHKRALLRKDVLIRGGTSKELQLWEQPGMQVGFGRKESYGEDMSRIGFNCYDMDSFLKTSPYESGTMQGPLEYAQDIVSDFNGHPRVYLFDANKMMHIGEVGFVYNFKDLQNKLDSLLAVIKLKD